LFTREKGLVFDELATFEVDRGSDDRLWGPAPEQSTAEEIVDRTNGADVDTALAAAGIETTDLLALDPLVFRSFPGAALVRGPWGTRR
jgi:hypothetical protein